MSDDLAGLTPKERFECLKLKAEIAELERSLFKRGAFWAALAPVILAGLGLVFTWSSGWFSTQQDKLQAIQERLESKNERLETRSTLLADSNKALVVARKTYLAAIDSLESERIRARDNLSKARVDLAAERARLRQSFTAESIRVVAVTDSLRHQTDLAPIEVHLATILDTTRSPGPYEPAVQALIKMLAPGSKARVDAATRIAGWVAMPIPLEKRALLMYAMLKGTGQREWRDSLYAVMNDPRANYDYYKIFLHGEWSDTEFFDVCKRAVRALIARDPSTLQAGSSLVLLADLPHRKTHPLEGFGAPGEYLDGLRFARDRALSRKLFNYDRQDALHALRGLAPASYFVTLARLVVAADSAFAEPLRQELEDFRRYGSCCYQLALAVGTRLGVPADADPSKWRAWLGEHVALAERWSAPNLEALRQEHATLLDALVVP